MPKLPIAKASPHVIELERVRRTIPIGLLLKLQEVAVLTGKMPKLDINGMPTGEYDTLRATERLDGLNKLINKAMPDRQEAPMLPEDSSSSKTVDVRNLSNEELEALAYAKPTALLISSASGDGPGPSDSGNSGDAAPGGDEGTAAPGPGPLHDGVHERLYAGLGAQGGSGAPGSVHGGSGAETVPEVDDLPAASDG